MTDTPQTAQPPSASAVALATISHAVCDAYGNVYPALVPLVAAAMGFGLVSGSLVITGVGVASSILQPVFGEMSDRRGSALLAPIAFAMVAVCTGLLGLAHEVVVFLALAAVAGVANGAFHPPSLSLVRSASGSRPGQYTSVFFMGGTVGRAVGPVLMVACAAWLGVGGLAAMAVPGLILAAVLGAAGRRADRRRAPAAPSLGAGNEVSTFRRLQGRAAPLTTVMLIAVTGGAATSTISTFWPLLHHHTVAALFGSSAVIGVMMLAGSVGTIAGGHAADRMAHHRVLALACTATTLSLGAFALARGPWIYPFAALSGFFGMSGFAVTTVMGQNLLPERVAMASGLVFGVSNALTSGIVALLALAASAWGATAALLLGAAICLCGLPAALAYPGLVGRPNGPVRSDLEARAATS